MDPLMMTIQGGSATTLRSVMKQMCKANPDIRKVAESILLVRASEVKCTPSSPESAGQKRKLEGISHDEMVPRYDTRANCDAEFDVSRNKEEKCAWHTGEKEVNDDPGAWEDYEEWRAGPMNSTIDNPDFAEGYKWTCCEKDGNDTGMRNIEGNAGLPDARHQKLGGGERKGGNSVADPLEQKSVASKPIGENEVQVPSKATAVITVSDSSDVEEKSGEEETEYMETCAVCRQEYDGEDEAQDCLSHSEVLILHDDCPLSDEEKANLDEEKNPEWFYWSCCGGPAEDEGCRQYNYHCPDRGMGY